MASFHQTIIAGNLGRDPEMRYLPSGEAVCNFSVAVTESWKDKNSGEKRENTTWYRVNAFGKLAEICGNYLKKGSGVLLTGKMQSRKWEKDGVERESWELKADQMQMLGGKPADGGQGGGQQGGGQQQRQSPPPSAQQKPKSSFDDLGEDIPF